MTQKRSKPQADDQLSRSADWKELLEEWVWKRFGAGRGVVVLNLILLRWVIVRTTDGASTIRNRGALAFPWSTYASLLRSKTPTGAYSYDQGVSRSSENQPPSRATIF